MGRGKSDQAPENESDSKLVVETLLDDVIRDVVKEKEESEKWERLVSTSRLLNGRGSPHDHRNVTPMSPQDSEDSDGCFDDRRRLPYDFCTAGSPLVDYDYSSATTTSDDDSAAASAADLVAPRVTTMSPQGHPKKGRASSSSSSGAFSRASYVNRRRKRKRPPTLEMTLAKRRVAVEMLKVSPAATAVTSSDQASKDAASCDQVTPKVEIEEQQLALPLDHGASGFVVDEFLPLVKEEPPPSDTASSCGDSALGRGKRVRRANSRYSDDTT